MDREEIYRRNTLYHIRKEYGECQGRYSGYHSISVELVRLQISHIEDNDAVNRQIYDSDHYNGYEYQQHPEDDTGSRRVRNKPADVSNLVAKADNANNEIHESLPPMRKELYNIFHYHRC